MRAHQRRSGRMMAFYKCGTARTFTRGTWMAMMAWVRRIDGGRRLRPPTMSHQRCPADQDPIHLDLGAAGDRHDVHGLAPSPTEDGGARREHDNSDYESDCTRESFHGFGSLFSFTLPVASSRLVLTLTMDPIRCSAERRPMSRPRRVILFPIVPPESWAGIRY